MSRIRYNSKSANYDRQRVVAWMAICIFFVVNVYWNDARRLKMNVNRLSNGNVWNADYRLRLVFPLLAISPVII